jgi:hypothetical protein
MEIEFITAIFLLICLIFFISINLYNIHVVHRRRDSVKIYAEVEQPSGFVVNIAGVGTFAYFFEGLAYLSLVFTGFTNLLRGVPFYFNSLLIPYMQVLGYF